MKMNLKTNVCIVILMLFSAVGCDVLQPGDERLLQASGVIETAEISVSAETSGRVTHLSVDEGDPVRKGDELIRLDNTLLNRQRQVAETALASAQAGMQAARVNLETAQAQLDISLMAALSDERLIRPTLWSQSRPADFDQPVWYYSKQERMRATEAEEEAARTALAEAETNLKNLQNQVGSVTFLQVEERLSRARIAYQLADEVLAQANSSPDNQNLQAAAQSAFDRAKDEMEKAQEEYDDVLSTESAQDILDARAEVAVKQEIFDLAQETLRGMQTGADSPAIVMARQAVDQAEAGLEQARTAVEQARANLALIAAQAQKLTVVSPLSGVVLTRSVQVGEVLQAGTPALVIADLQKLKVTVYISEDRYGEIKLGKQASLSVDSFPGITFDAVVSRIADQAEFTPRNVQTKEQRQTTVYAVELRIENPDGRLKPGMPVDVVFDVNP